MLAALPMMAALAAVAPMAEPPAPAPPAAVTEARAGLVEALLAELRSDDPRRQAWAAHQLGACGLVEGREALQELALLPPMDRPPVMACDRAVIDALARLPGTTAPAVVAALAARTDAAAQAVVLAAREPAAHRDTLLAVNAATPLDAVWLASGELLVELRDREAVRRLVADLRLLLEVVVHDGDPSTGMFGRRNSGFMRLSALPGYPPAASHRLVTQAVVGATVLTLGPQPVLWLRREGSGSARQGYPSTVISRDAVRLGWLHRLATVGIPSLATPTRIEVAWRDAESLRARVAEARAGIARERSALIARLVDADLLDPEAVAGLEERIEIVLQDRRSDQRSALPAVGSSTAAAPVPVPAPAPALPDAAPTTSEAEF